MQVKNLLLDISFLLFLDSQLPEQLKNDRKYLGHLFTYCRMKNFRLSEDGIIYTDGYQTSESMLTHFLHFHNRPIVKYCYTCVSQHYLNCIIDILFDCDIQFGYVLFLLFFSYYMLFAFDPPSDTTPDIHWTEILTIIFVTTMLFEDVRQVSVLNLLITDIQFNTFVYQLWFQDDRSICSKIATYFDLTNRSSNLCLVLPAYLLFYTGLILRFVLNDETTFSAARSVLLLNESFRKSSCFIGL